VNITYTFEYLKKNNPLFKKNPVYPQGGCAWGDMFVEKRYTTKNRKPASRRAGMATQVGSAEELNAEELVPKRRDEICYFRFIRFRLPYSYPIICS
jgi:hypothetical protein